MGDDMIMVASEINSTELLLRGQCVVINHKTYLWYWYRPNGLICYFRRQNIFQNPQKHFQKQFYLHKHITSSPSPSSKGRLRSTTLK